MAKSAAFWQVVNYHEAYGLYACSGILFNHDSPLRPDRFVTKKITEAVKRIRDGSAEKLHLGNTSIVRDWGWAPEYVEAMWLMMQLEEPDTFVISTGEAYSLEDFVDTAFSLAGLNWQDHVVIDPDLYRPADIQYSRGNSKKAKEKLGWEAKYSMKDVVRMMMED